MPILLTSLGINERTQRHINTYMIPSNLSKASKDIKGYMQIEYLDIMDSYTIIQGLDSWMNF
jgi:hypothetical protein